MDTTILRCPGCGANLIFNADAQNWVCESCGRVSTQKDIYNITKDSDLDNKTHGQDIDRQPELNLFRCQSCGAEMVTDENTTATFCVYCGNAGIMKSRLEGKYRPDLIIPFNMSRQDAIDEYNKLRAGRYLAPDEFGDPQHIEKLSGVYVPFWLYDGSLQAHVSGTRTESTSWTSGNYTYTTRNTYHMERAGNMSFQKVPADGSKKFDDTLMDCLEPFNFSELQPFNYSYLSGFLAEKYDVTDEENQERAKRRMAKAFMNEIYKTIHGTLINIEEDKTAVFHNAKYALLPVWMLNTIINGKTYTYAMNGQTGRIIGNIPISYVKVLRYFAIRFLIAMAALCALAYMFVM